MSWLRWWEGTVTDPKWRVVAARAKRPVGDVIAVWAYLLEEARRHDGALPDLDMEIIGAALGYDPDDVHSIVQAMRDKGSVSDQGVTNWRKYAPGRIDDIRLRPEWRELRSIVFARDNFTCTYCGVHGKKLQCDHVVPLTRGGSSELSNLTTACAPCNQSKRDKLPLEWRK